MNDSTRYLLDTIHSHVWSGFYSPADVDEAIEDLLEGEDGADEAVLRAAVGPEFARKRAAEATWPQTTDCDRLDAAFKALDAAGIIALQNAGYTLSDGLDDVAEVWHRRGRTGSSGYCFYHGQDLERAVAGHGVMLAFGSFGDNPDNKLQVGRSIQATMERHGLRVEWNGDAETRLNLPSLDWKRRGPLA